MNGKEFLDANDSGNITRVEAERIIDGMNEDADKLVNHQQDLVDALQGMLDLYERLIPHIKDAPVTEEDVQAEQTAVNLLEKLK